LPVSSVEKENSCTQQLEKHSRVIEHDQDGFSGLFSVRSVKYTTAPSLAHEVLEAIQQKIRPSSANRPKGDTPGRKEVAPGAGTVPCLAYLRGQYGDRAGAVSCFIRSNEDCAAWISTDPPLLRAEVEYCIAEEMAFTLEDIVLRRTGLGTVECPPAEVLDRLACCMGEILGWSTDRKQREIDQVVSRYSLLEHHMGEHRA